MTFIKWFFDTFHGYDAFGRMSILGVFLYALTWPLVIFLIGRRYDEQFKENTALFFPFGNRRVWRIGMYAGNMLLQGFGLKFRPFTASYAVFQGYNLWKSAPRFERILVCIHLLPAILGILALCFYYMHKAIIYL